MGLLDDASGWLAEQMQAATENPARRVYYVRGAERIDLTGLAWNSNEAMRRTAKEAGEAVIHGTRDYLIPVSALVLNGTAWEPKKGDRIEETTGGVTLKFDVLPLLGEPHARYSDDERTIWRVHTTETAKG